MLLCARRLLRPLGYKQGGHTGQAAEQASALVLAKYNLVAWTRTRRVHISRQAHLWVGCSHPHRINQGLRSKV
eukprot:COSAG02_NODE_3959_length_5983_cov_9.304176_5_plen_73_part_00